MSGPVFTLLGGRVRHCDGIARRSFLKAGAMGFGALTLADVLRAESAAGIRSSNKAIINIHLDGGPTELGSKRDVAAMVNCCTRTVDNLMANGYPHIKIGCRPRGGFRG